MDFPDSFSGNPPASGGSPASGGPLALPILVAGKHPDPRRSARRRGHPPYRPELPEPGWNFLPAGKLGSSGPIHKIRLWGLELSLGREDWLILRVFRWNKSFFILFF